MSHLEGYGKRCTLLNHFHSRISYCYYALSPRTPQFHPNPHCRYWTVSVTGTLLSNPGMDAVMFSV